MLSRREKIRRQLYQLKEDIFLKQVETINKDTHGRQGKRDKVAVKHEPLPSVEAMSVDDSLYLDHAGLLRTARLEEEREREDEPTGEESSSSVPGDTQGARGKRRIRGRPPRNHMTGRGKPVKPKWLLEAVAGIPGTEKGKRGKKRSLYEDHQGENKPMEINPAVKPSQRKSRKSLVGEDVDGIVPLDVEAEVVETIGIVGQKNSGENMLCDPVNEDDLSSVNRLKELSTNSNGAWSMRQRTSVMGLNGRYPRSDFIVSEDVRQRVQKNLQRRRNGIHRDPTEKISEYLQSIKSEGLVIPATNNKLSDEKPVEKNSTNSSPSKNSEGSVDIAPIQTSTPNPVIFTLETRNARRKLESDLDSNASDQFENVDDEISIRSSRDTTPDRENMRVRRLSHKVVDLARLATRRQLHAQLQEVNTENQSDHTETDTDSVPVQADVSDNERLNKPDMSPRRHKRRRKTIQTVEEASRDSNASTNSSGGISRHSEDWRVLRTLHS